MKRTISTLGLALIAALAFGALAAQAASAATHHITANEAWTPTATAENAQVFESTTGEGKGFSCENVSATGEVEKTTSEITVTPSYSNCVAFEPGKSVAASVEPNGCDYRFTGTTTKGNPTNAEEHANVDIINHTSPGEPCHIEIRVTAFKFKCASVPNQTVAHAVRYKQDGEAITIEATAHGIVSTTTNSIACPTGGGTVEHTNGSYTGNVTVKGHNSGGAAVPLTLTENAT